MATQHYVVTGDQYRVVDRRMRDIKRKLDQKSGSPLDPEAVADALQQISEPKTVVKSLPTEMTIAGQTYEVIDLPEKDKKSLYAGKIVEIATKMNADLGKKDCQFLLDHQMDIPDAFTGRVVFAFPGWRDPNESCSLAYIIWGRSWNLTWSWIGTDWGGIRLLRHK